VTLPITLISGLSAMYWKLETSWRKGECVYLVFFKDLSRLLSWPLTMISATWLTQLNFIHNWVATGIQWSGTSGCWFALAYFVLNTMQISWVFLLDMFFSLINKHNATLYEILFFPLLFHISLGKLGWIQYSPLSSIYCRTLVFF